MIECPKVYDRVGFFHLYPNQGTESYMSFTHNRVAAFFGLRNLGIFRSKCDAYQMLPGAKIGLAAFVTIWQATATRRPNNHRTGRRKLG